MRVICLIIISFICMGCPDIYEYDTQIRFENSSGFSIFVSYPLVGEVTYPNTTISFNYGGHTVKPKSYAYGGISNIEVKDWILSFPEDTVSVFIFSKDTLDKYSWETIQRDYKILQRYDLSWEDFNLLSNENGLAFIPYPPTELMKGMRMYPPYSNE